MLAPVYQLLFGQNKSCIPSLELTEDQITISYKTYKVDNQFDMQEISDQQLAPGQTFSVFQRLLTSKVNFISVASISHGRQGTQAVPHVMVLDTYDQDQDLLIFKNTYNDPNSGQTKRFTINRTHPDAPKELYFVHIETPHECIENSELENIEPKRRKMDVDICDWDFRKDKSTRKRLNGRIIERDEFSGEVLESFGYRFFDTSSEILWV